MWALRDDPKVMFMNTISGDMTAISGDITNVDIYELFFNNFVQISDIQLTDAEANAVHYRHAQQHGYPISTSVYHSMSTCQLGKIDKALEDLNNGLVLPYKNNFDGTIPDTSFMVPNPGINLQIIK